DGRTRNCPPRLLHQSAEWCTRRRGDLRRPRADSREEHRSRIRAVPDDRPRHPVDDRLPWADGRGKGGARTVLQQTTMTDRSVAGKAMSNSDKRKQCLYFSAEMLTEIASEAARQDRSLSWIVQKAWRAARREIKRVPSV